MSFYNVLSIPFAQKQPSRFYVEQLDVPSREEASPLLSDDVDVRGKFANIIPVKHDISVNIGRCVGAFDAPSLPGFPKKPSESRARQAPPTRVKSALRSLMMAPCLLFQNRIFALAPPVCRNRLNIPSAFRRVKRPIHVY